MDDIEECIRQPDNVKKERLLNNNIDDELLQALELSKNEFASLQEKEEQKANELIYELAKKREEQFVTLKPKLNKLGLIDKPNLRIYNNVLSIIQLYEEGLITKYSLDKEEYTKTICILKSIRLTNEELNNITQLIQSE